MTGTLSLGAVDWFLLAVYFGAIPAMVFLGVVMMPFYYSTRVHSVSEYLRRRFNNQTHLLNSVVFASRRCCWRASTSSPSRSSSSC